MKFQIPQKELKLALSAVQGIAEKKSTIPVLQNILIKSVGETGLQIIATNLDLAMTKDAEATIERKGFICIPGRKLFEITNSLPAGDVKFESEDNYWVKITCGKSKFRLAGVDKDQFPEIPKPKEMPITLNGDLFAEMIGRVTFAITNESSRFTLSGAKFLVFDGKAVMVSTDGHRLSYIERTPSEGQPDLGEEKMEVLIPKLALVEAAKMGQSGGIQLGEDTNHIFFNAGGQLLSARKLMGTFPNYEMVMPKPGDNDKCATVDGGEFKAAVRRISLMADERNRSMRITLFENGVQLLANSKEQGEGKETIDAEYGGDEILLGYNYHYLADFLNLVKDEDKVVLMVKDANAQTELRFAGDDGFRHIIMPLRIDSNSL